MAPTHCVGASAQSRARQVCRARFHAHNKNRKCLARGPAIGAPLARARFRRRPAAMGGARGATPRLAATGCASACRLRRWRSSSAHHEGRATDTAARPRYGASKPRLKPLAARCGRGVPARRWGVGLVRVRAQAGEADPRRCRVGHGSFRGSSSPASLLCCESWRGHGCASGFMAATVRRKQFPLRYADSSRSKFFAPPGPPRSFRPLRDAASPTPA